MRYEKLFDGTDIPVLGLGTYTLGGGLSTDRSRDREHVALIREAVAMGYRHIDTAQLYGGGHTEELVGEGVSGFDREQLFITTKVRSGDLAYRRVHRALEGSLERLRTSYVDLYLIHWPNPAIPLKSTFKAFNELLERGSIRYAGVSNFRASQVQRARELCDAPLAVNQVEYSVGCRAPERNGVLRSCREQGILLTAYEPLGKGRLIADPVLQKVADRHRVSTARVALAWLLARPGIITIPMTSRREHLEDNLASLDLVLDEQDLRDLEGLA
ncbi:MAG: aldo/keto reductase [Spirochaetota bacterium]